MVIIGLKSGKEITVCGVLKSLKLDKMTGEIMSIKIENKSSERLELIDIESIDYIFEIEAKEEEEMETIELLKEKILYKRIKRMTKDKLILEDGTEVYFECTDWDCCASASGEWKTAELDAVITDVKMIDYNQDESWVSGFPTSTAKIVLYHNQNSVAQADLYADAGNGGYYYSVLSVFVNEENIGDILSA